MHYHYGPKDLLAILFYVFITIILHAVVQEYILDVSDACGSRRQKLGRCRGWRGLTAEETAALDPFAS